MGTQQLERSLRAHLRRDDALEILLDTHVIDRSDRPVGVQQEPQSSLEGLILLPLPMEVDPDGHAAQGEGGLPFRHQSDLRSPGEFLPVLPHQHQAALFGPDRELPAQCSLVREDESAIQRAACLGFALINANGKKGLLIDHAIEREDSALLTVARASEN